MKYACICISIENVSTAMECLINFSDIIFNYFLNNTPHINKVVYFRPMLHQTSTYLVDCKFYRSILRMILGAAYNSMVSDSHSFIDLWSFVGSKVVVYESALLCRVVDCVVHVQHTLNKYMILNSSSSSLCCYSCPNLRISNGANQPHLNRRITGFNCQNHCQIESPSILVARLSNF